CLVAAENTRQELPGPGKNCTAIAAQISCEQSDVKPSSTLTRAALKKNQKRLLSMAIGAQLSSSRNPKQRVFQGKSQPAAKPLAPATLAMLQQALALHQSGRLDEAMELYGQVLRDRPSQPDALHLSGVIHHQRGESQVAVRLIQKAL